MGVKDNTGTPIKTKPTGVGDCKSYRNTKLKDCTLENGAVQEYGASLTLIRIPAHLNVNASGFWGTFCAIDATSSFPKNTT